MKKIITFLSIALITLSSVAQEVFTEGFDTGIPSSFTLLNEDGNTPTTNLIGIFQNKAWIGGFVFNGQEEIWAGSTSSYNPPGTADDWMITPVINITSNNYLYWSARSGNSSDADGYEVRISTTGKNIADFNSVLFSVTEENSFWTERSVDLSAYEGETVYIAFRNNSYDKYILAVDYITVKETFNDDPAIISILTEETQNLGDNVTVTAEIQNLGLNNITSFDLNWSTDGGVTVNTDAITGVNLVPNAVMAVIHSQKFVAANTGSYTDLEVWVSNPNGMWSKNTSNDSLQKRIFVKSGTGVQRNVLFEEFTTAGCQFCPDGHVVMADILSQNTNVIPVSVHSCFGTDAMTNQEALDLCSTLGNNSAPAGMVDRIQFEGENKPAHSRSFWKTRVNDRSIVPSEASLLTTGTFNSTTRAVSIDVDISFVDHVLDGDIRLSLMIVEDSLSGTGTGWNQVNYYNTQSGHPMQGRGNPIIGYQHRHVLRDILPSTWGDASVVPSFPSMDTTYSKNFSFTLNNNYDTDRVSFVAVLSYKGLSSDGYQVINANEVKLSDTIVDKGLDAALISLNIPSVVMDGDSVEIKATIRNVDADTLNSFDLNWSIDNGTVHTVSYTNLNLAFGDELEFNHNDKAELVGLHSLKKVKVWASNINGGNDDYQLNNSKEKLVQISLPIDGALSRLLFDDVIGDGQNLSIKGEITNKGVDTLNSIDVNWTVNGGTVNTETINNLYLSYGESTMFNHSIVWAANGIGTTNHFKVWIDSSNGSIETRNSNDTLTKDVKVVSAVDLELVHLSVNDTLIKGETVKIKGRVKNIGAQQVNSFVINWSVNGGTINKDTISNISIPNNIAYDFIHQYQYTPPSTLEAGELSVYIDKVNNLSSQLTFNDTINLSFVAVVGIIEISTLLDKLIVYPNPSSYHTNLDLSLIKNLRLQVAIFDITGKLVYQKNYGEMTYGNHKLPIDVSSLSNGLYIMKIQAGEEVLSKKISVNR